MINKLANSLTQTEIELREKIYADWQKLDWEEQYRQVAVHLRDTHSSNPLYQSKDIKNKPDGSPAEFWFAYATSCATMCPPWIRAVAELRKSSIQNDEKTE